MKIIIETPCQEEHQRVFDYVKRFCIDNFQEFELSVDGTNLTFKQEKVFLKEEMDKILGKEEIKKEEKQEKI